MGYKVQSATDHRGPRLEKKANEIVLRTRRKSYPAYSGGGSNLSARISCITRRRFSTSARNPSTSVGESEVPVVPLAPLLEPELLNCVRPGDNGSRLDAVPVFEEPDAEAAY